MFPTFKRFFFQFLGNFANFQVLLVVGVIFFDELYLCNRTIDHKFMVDSPIEKIELTVENLNFEI
jgi:hypothetical protein